MEPTKAALDIPKEVYYVAGVLLLANLGTIVSIMFAAFKAVWWASKLDSKVDEARATAVRAHKRIDTLEREDSGETDGPSA
ncbi:MAG: hypothetical protein OEW15_11715 [Nitrospirota bacterium]|nr:hypothetical protein [Nitrospirota bacterium]